MVLCPIPTLTPISGNDFLSCGSITPEDHLLPPDLKQDLLLPSTLSLSPLHSSFMTTTSTTTIAHSNTHSPPPLPHKATSSSLERTPPSVSCFHGASPNIPHSSLGPTIQVCIDRVSHESSHIIPHLSSADPSTSSSPDPDPDLTYFPTSDTSILERISRHNKA